jgi:hypothetical protein
MTIDEIRKRHAAIVEGRDFHCHAWEDMGYLLERLALAEKVCGAVKVSIQLLNMSVSGEVRSVLEEWQAAVDAEKQG